MHKFKKEAQKQLEEEADTNVDDKHQQFYKELFKKEEVVVEQPIEEVDIKTPSLVTELRKPKKTKPEKQGFTKQLERIKD